jgi:hypothetical protein
MVLGFKTRSFPRISQSGYAFSVQSECVSEKFKVCWYLAEINLSSPYFLGFSEASFTLQNIMDGTKITRKGATSP